MKSTVLGSSMFLSGPSPRGTPCLPLRGQTGIADSPTVGVFPLSFPPAYLFMTKGTTYTPQDSGQPGARMMGGSAVAGGRDVVGAETVGKQAGQHARTDCGEAVPLG